MSRTKATVFFPGVKKQVIRIVPVIEQFDSPVVAAHMARIAEENARLRKWRDQRKGKKVSNPR